MNLKKNYMNVNTHAYLPHCPHLYLRLPVQKNTLHRRDQFVNLLVAILGHLDFDLQKTFVRNSSTDRFNS